MLGETLIMGACPSSVFSWQLLTPLQAIIDNLAGKPEIVAQSGLSVRSEEMDGRMTHPAFEELPISIAQLADLLFNYATAIKYLQRPVLFPNTLYLTPALTTRTPRGLVLCQ